MKKLPDKFKDIQPTILEVEDSNRLVDEVLDCAETGEYEPIEIFEVLVDLLGRLSDRYKGFTESAAVRAYDWAKSSFDVTNKRLVDASLTVLMNAPSLETSMAFVKSKIPETNQEDIISLLEEFCQEAEETLSANKK